MGSDHAVVRTKTGPEGSGSGRRDRVEMDWARGVDGCRRATGARPHGTRIEENGAPGALRAPPSARQVRPVRPSSCGISLRRPRVSTGIGCWRGAARKMV